jgi:hypothetical protein
LVAIFAVSLWRQNSDGKLCQIAFSIKETFFSLRRAIQCKLAIATLVQGGDGTSSPELQREDARACHGIRPVMEPTRAHKTLLILAVWTLLTGRNSPAADEVVIDAAAAAAPEVPPPPPEVAAVRPVAAVFSQPGASVPSDSFHKKSQYIIVASKIIRPNTFYQVRPQML